MNSFRLSLLRPFFKGDSLESEFAFVNYYHSQPINRLLHTLAIPLLIFGILTITSSISSQLSLAFVIFYCLIVSLYDYKAALGYLILFGMIFILTTIVSTRVSYGLLVFMIGLIMQGLGHYVFQKYSPAFRLFEAVFTTPVFLMMSLINDHNQPFWKNLKSETIKWEKLLRK